MSNVVIAVGSRSCFYMVDGAGNAPAHRRLFDPKRFHVVLFDQRGVVNHGHIRALMGIIDTVGIWRGFVNHSILISFCYLVVLGAVHWRWRIDCYPEHVSGLILRGIFLALGRKWIGFK